MNHHIHSLLSVRDKPSLIPVRTTYRRVLKGSRRPVSIHALNNYKDIIPKAMATFAGTLLLTSSLLTGRIEASEDISVPMAETQELFNVQRTMVEAWSIIQETFVDGSFNNTNWEQDLKRHLVAVSRSQSTESGQEQLKGMISDLGDPYTRWVPSKEYSDFLMDSVDAEIQGVGLLIASDPDTGKHFVLAPIKGGPAEKAGIQQGDEVISVNGETLQGRDGETAAKALRGKQGSSVDVEIARVVDMVPGEVGPGKLSEEARLQHKKFRLRRERVQLSPIFATALHTEEGHTYGYIRMLNFSRQVSNDMKKAVNQLLKDGSEGFIIDLRNNPGGLVSSVLDVANLWMNGDDHPTIFSVSGRENPGIKQSVSREVKLQHGHAITDLPLTVLVNKQSASASEILAGAIKDNNRGDIIGETTFGKAKIQSIYELSDGSALFVTVAKYKTPNGTNIDKVGVAPSLTCTLESKNQTLAGIPVAPGLSGAKEGLIEDIENDACIKTAEDDLSHKMMI